MRILDLGARARWGSTATTATDRADLTQDKALEWERTANRLAGRLVQLDEGHLLHLRWFRAKVKRLRGLLRIASRAAWPDPENDPPAAGTRMMVAEIIEEAEKDNEADITEEATYVEEVENNNGEADTADSSCDEDGPEGGEDMELDPPDDDGGPRWRAFVDAALADDEDDFAPPARAVRRPIPLPWPAAADADRGP